jgi:hypothetical protein
MRVFVCEERSDTSERDGMAQPAYWLDFRDAVAWRSAGSGVRTPTRLW